MNLLTPMLMHILDVTACMNMSQAFFFFLTSFSWYKPPVQYTYPEKSMKNINYNITDFLFAGI